jgi:hypothetical protein
MGPLTQNRAARDKHHESIRPKPVTRNTSLCLPTNLIFVQQMPKIQALHIP